MSSTGDVKTEDDFNWDDPDAVFADEPEKKKKTPKTPRKSSEKKNSKSSGGEGSEKSKDDKDDGKRKSRTSSRRKRGDSHGSAAAPVQRLLSSPSQKEFPFQYPTPSTTEPASGMTWEKLNDKEKIVYSKLFQRMDRDCDGKISADDVQEWRHSKLGDATLNGVWVLSSAGGDGTLDKDRFALAMRLIALAQTGKELNVASALEGSLPVADGFHNFPMPNVIPKDVIAKAFPKDESLSNLDSPVHPSAPLSQSSPAAPTHHTVEPSWSATDAEIDRWVDIFARLDAQQTGAVEGAALRPVLQASGLRQEVLSALWRMVDLYGSGKLTLKQFLIIVILMREMKRGCAQPTFIAEALAHNAARWETKKFTSSTAHAILSGVPAIHWNKFEEVFRAVDKENKGFVGSEQVTDLWGRCGVSTTELNALWGLCSRSEEGTRLTKEEFIVGMYVLLMRKEGKIDAKDILGRSSFPSSLFLKPQGSERESHIHSTTSKSAEIGNPSVGDDVVSLAKEVRVLQLSHAQEADKLRAQIASLREGIEGLRVISAKCSELDKKIKATAAHAEAECNFSAQQLESVLSK